MKRNEKQDPKRFDEIQEGDSVTMLWQGSRWATGKAVEFREGQGWVLNFGSTTDVVTRETFIRLRKASKNVLLPLDEDRRQCQICARLIKITRGVVAHHGYQRPGDGAIYNTCYGARQLPYDQSRDAIPTVIGKIDVTLKARKDLLAQVKKGTIAVPSGLYAIFGQHTPIEPGQSRYEERRRNYEAQLRAEIIALRQQQRFLQKRYDDWKAPMGGKETT